MMNKITLLKVASALCVVALVACGALILARSMHIGLRYANAENYTAGAAALDGAVKNLDIDWTDGSVTIAYHDGDAVELSETAPRAISADAGLRWWLDGDTLRVRYAKSGYMSLRGLDKAMTVTLPEGVRLDSVKIDGSSADVVAPRLPANNVLVDLSSGDIALDTAGAADSVALSSTSGTIRATLSDANRAVVTTTSGGVQASVGDIDALSVSTTSGDIALDGGAAKTAKIDSTSGRIDVALQAFDDLRIDSTSGNVTAALPAEPGFAGDIDTTSGKFDSALPLKQEGKRFACGDGSARLRIHTTSGDIRLEEASAR